MLEALELEATGDDDGDALRRVPHACFHTVLEAGGLPIQKHYDDRLPLHTPSSRST